MLSITGRAIWQAGEIPRCVGDLQAHRQARHAVQAPLGRRRHRSGIEDVDAGVGAWLMPETTRSGRSGSSSAGRASHNPPDCPPPRIPRTRRAPGLARR